MHLSLEFWELTGQLKLKKLVRTAIDAFFHNDLMTSVQKFMAAAKGSFGLCVTSSLDVHKHIVFASRGQTKSIAFYPEEGMNIVPVEYSVTLVLRMLSCPNQV